MSNREYYTEWGPTFLLPDNMFQGLKTLVWATEEPEVRHSLLMSLTTLLSFFLIKWWIFYIQELIQFSPKWSMLGFLSTVSRHSCQFNVIIWPYWEISSCMEQYSLPTPKVFFQKNEKHIIFLSAPSIIPSDRMQSLQFMTQVTSVFPLPMAPS